MQTRGRAGNPGRGRRDGSRSPVIGRPRERGSGVVDGLIHNAPVQGHIGNMRYERAGQRRQQPGSRPIAQQDQQRERETQPSQAIGNPTS
jgi:hypothetical protein